MRLKISEAEIQALTYINAMLHKNYERKMFFKKYIAPAFIVNFTVSIIFIIIKTFYPSLMTDTLWIILGGLSIISILFLQWKLSFNKTIRVNFPLNA